MSDIRIILRNADSTLDWVDIDDNEDEDALSSAILDAILPWKLLPGDVVRIERQAPSISEALGDADWTVSPVSLGPLDGYFEVRSGNRVIVQTHVRELAQESETYKQDLTNCRLIAAAQRMKRALVFYADPLKWLAEHPGEEIQIPDFYSESEFGERATEVLSTI